LASAKKNKPNSKGSSSRKGRAAGDDDTIFNEVLVVVLLAVTLVLFCSNLGIGGALGGAISGLFFGLFGIMNYLFPLILFVGAIFVTANIRHPRIATMTAGGISLFIFCCAFLQLVTAGEYGFRNNIGLYFTEAAANHDGGGLFGGLLTHLFTVCFGTIGAYILTAAGLVVSAIVMTRTHPVAALGTKSRAAAEKALERREQNRRDREDLKEERREERARERQRAMEERRRERLKEEARAVEEEEGNEIRRREASRRRREEERRERDRRRREEFYDYEGGAEEYGSLVPIDAEPYDSASGRYGQVSHAEEAFGAEPPEREEASERKKKRRKGSPDAVMPSFLVPSMAKLQNGGSAPESANEDGKPEGKAFSEENAEDAGEPEGAKEKPQAKKKETLGGEGLEKETAGIKESIEGAEKSKKDYRTPPLSLLAVPKRAAAASEASIRQTAKKLEETLRDFGVAVKVTDYSQGPTVTRFELHPEQGVKVSRIVALTDDIKLNLAAEEIRIEAPIPGKAAVGIEVPNKQTASVSFRELLESDEFKKSRARLSFAVGKDIGGRCVVTDIAKMPHLLIAGATGSGKSVCINTLIMSILYKSSPDEVRMVMIDPKVVELKIYDGIPHLLIPVVTDPKKAAGALNWAVSEMTDRYKKFAEMKGVRDLASYNERIDRMNESLAPEERLKHLPQILVIVDELADLMMVAPSEVEDAICRLAQLARAAGIHLVIATQRPSVNVVTGLIKANMPSRIALAVSSGVDSRTILDMNGAEKLLGKGDMLFYPQGYPKPVRVQGAYVSDEEISRVVSFLAAQNDSTMYNEEVSQKILMSAPSSEGAAADDGGGRDQYFAEAGRFIIEKDKASIGMLQRMFKIGFNRAARIMDQLADAGVVGGEEGTKPRRILMTAAEFEEFLNGSSAAEG